MAPHMPGPMGNRLLTMPPAARILGKPKRGRGQAMPATQTKGKQTMFARFYTAKATAPAGAVYICRDNHTGQTIATGTKAQMESYRAAFGLCHIARA